MSKQIDLEKVAEKAWDIANDPDFDQFEACTALKDAALSIKQAQETIAALEMDAARYQKLVQSGKFVPATLSPSCIWGLRTNGTHTTKQELDYAVDAIDTAMEASNA